MGSVESRTDNVGLAFAPDALDEIADQAVLRGTGARGPRAVLEEVLLNVMNDVPGRTDSVTPTLVRREKSA